MNEITMPAAEATVDTSDELASYELAFHVLPTVAEGEVTSVEDTIKKIISDAEGQLGLTEPAQRFELAYELKKMFDGKYRRFTTSYFGWIRFTAAPAVASHILAEVEDLPEVLRALLVRLNRQEEAHPFFLHEALAARKQVTTIDTESTDEDDEIDNDEVEDDETTNNENEVAAADDVDTPTSVVTPANEVDTNEVDEQKEATTT